MPHAPGKVNLSCSVDVEMKDALSSIAAIEDRSINQIVNYALKDYIANYQNVNPDQPRKLSDYEERVATLSELFKRRY